jgi:hypothetical protein
MPSLRGLAIGGSTGVTHVGKSPLGTSFKLQECLQVFRGVTALTVLSSWLEKVSRKHKQRVTCLHLSGGPVLYGVLPSSLGSLLQDFVALRCLRLTVDTVLGPELLRTLSAPGLCPMLTHCCVDIIEMIDDVLADLVAKFRVFRPTIRGLHIRVAHSQITQEGLLGSFKAQTALGDMFMLLPTLDPSCLQFRSPSSPFTVSVTLGTTLEHGSWERSDHAASVSAFDCAWRSQYFQALREADSAIIVGTQQ